MQRTLFRNERLNESRKRGCHLTGSEWLKNSISVWSISKSPGERSLPHPAVFPVELAERVLKCWTVGFESPTVLDPFAGTGSTLVAAARIGYPAAGVDISESFLEVARERLVRAGISVKLVDGSSLKAPLKAFGSSPKQDQGSDCRMVLVKGDAREADRYFEPGSFSIVFTSPPYWIIHNRKRTADGKQSRPYSDDPRDLGNVNDYDKFLAQLDIVWRACSRLLVQRGILAVNVMDLRIGADFIPFHCHVVQRVSASGFKLIDLAIWDRRADYNNLKPLGFPRRFILNRVHEYILVFEKG